MAKMSIKIPILMYHDIELGNPEYDRTEIEDRPYVLPEPQFEEQMKFLSEQGYRTVSLVDFVSHVKSNNPLPEKSVIITFDDGHISNYLKACPILKKYGFKAVFFIVAGFVGRRGMLTWDQIRDMANKGMEIGSHTLTHSPPSKLSNEELEYELKESKRILEDQLGQEVKWLSSPTGYYNRAIESIAKDVGYEVVCTSKFGVNSRNSNLFSLERIAIKRSYSMADFESLIRFESFTLLQFKVGELFRSNLKKILGMRLYEIIRKQLLNLQMRSPKNSFLK